jgi:uncharacterized protein (DUF1015 family)
VTDADNTELPALTRSAENGFARGFGIALPGGKGLLAKVDDIRTLAALTPTEGSALLKSLDVTVLHELIFTEVFGIRGLDRIEYTRDADEAVARVAASTDTAAVITNPPSVDDMKRIAEGGEKMPQKSTFYYPKLLSGLVFWSMSDLEPA